MTPETGLFGVETLKRTTFFPPDHPAFTPTGDLSPEMVRFIEWGNRP